MKKSLRFSILFFLTASVFVLQSCFNDNRQDLYPTTGGCDTSNITYSGFVSNVMTSSCALVGCHDATTASSGVSLDDYNGVKTAATSGRLLGSITHTSGFFAMPYPQGSPKLPDCTIAKISAWVAKGAPNN